MPILLLSAPRAPLFQDNPRHTAHIESTGYYGTDGPGTALSTFGSYLIYKPYDNFIRWCDLHFTLKETETQVHIARQDPSSGRTVK